MKIPLKYYVGINIKSDRRQVFGTNGTPSSASHGKHFSAVIGPFRNLRAALYVRDRGFNNPQIRCPADAEKLCRVRSTPQRTRKLKRRAGVTASRRKPRRRKNPLSKKEWALIKRQSIRRHAALVKAGKVVRYVHKADAADPPRRKNPRRKLSPAQLRAGFGGKRRKIKTRK